jgi:hypothetical protein
MTQDVSWSRITLVDLSRDDATNVGERKQNAEGGCALPIWCAICAEPGDVSACAEEACGGNQVGGEVLHSRADGGKQDSVAGDADGCHQNEREEACLKAVGKVGTNGVDDGAPEVDWDDEVLGLCRG